ncbi:matrixin family metalloprotease [Pedobacter sp. PAMC26386]|nr:matrixin family metalloprotease [Pedobacter sp. PAMC26386]
MKKVFNKKAFYLFAAMGATIFVTTITGCKKNDSPSTDPSVKTATGDVSLDNVFADMKKIKSLGFDPLSVEVIPGGYRVEGDIRLTKRNLDASFNALSKQQGQYSTRYPITVTGGTRTINLALYDETNTAKFNEAFDSTVVALNNLKLPLKFVKVTDTTTADIITKFTDLGGADANGLVTLGQDGSFVDASGNPGKNVSLNSNPDAGYTTASRAFISSILNHEFGHAIGLRHTDYKNRLYSELRSSGQSTSTANQDKIITQTTKKLVDGQNGVGTWDKQTAANQKKLKEQVFNAYYNEGDATGTDAQATHIYGTPLTPGYAVNTATDPLSMMLSVTGTKGNLVFSSYDNIAFFGLYGNTDQASLIKKSLSETGTVTAAGQTLQQVVDAVKKLAK